MTTGVNRVFWSSAKTLKQESDEFKIFRVSSSYLAASSQVTYLLEIKFPELEIKLASITSYT